LDVHVGKKELPEQRARGNSSDDSPAIAGRQRLGVDAIRINSPRPEKLLFPLWEHYRSSHVGSCYARLSQLRSRMRLMRKALLAEFAKEHANIRGPLNAYIVEVEEANWTGPADIKARSAKLSSGTHSRRQLRFYRSKKRQQHELDSFLIRRAQARSKRSWFITLVHAFTKSFTNFSLESEHA